MREIRGEVGKKTPKKEMDNPSFIDVTGIKSRTDGASSRKVYGQVVKFMVNAIV